MCALVVLLLACYAPILRGMAGQWSTDEDMGHGWCVPLVAGWVVWRERARWRELPPRRCAFGFALLAAGAAMHAAAVVGAGLFAGSVALLFSLAGVVTVAGGVALLRAWAFPLLLLVFMLPKLAVVYNQVTLPLQLMATRLAETILLAFQVGVSRQGNILEVAGRQLAVVEACNGIRYLLSLGFMAVVFAYIADSKAWMRLALLLAAVPLAIAANGARVAAMAAWPALLEGTPHLLAGWLVFVGCLAAMAGIRVLVNGAYARFRR